MPRLVLHAGLPKTGTTSVQQFLDANRGALAEQGVFYRPVGDRRNRQDHNFLAMAFWPRVQRIYAGRYGDDLERLQRDSRDAWDTLLDEFRRADHEVLLVSAEFFTRANVKPIAEFVREQLADFDVSTVFYLRQPSAHYVSWLQQHVKGAGSLLPYSRQRSRWMPRLRRWEHVGDVVLREFDRGSLVGGDIVDDFASVIGVDVTGMERPADANESISAEGMDLLMEHRRIHFPDGPDRIHPETMALFRQIGECERHWGARTPLTSPCLHPELASYLDSDIEELRRLERRYGFHYRRIGSPRKLAPSPDREDLEGKRFDSLGDLMPIDAAARRELRTALEHDGVDFGARSAG
jgi:hypothetical protein